MKLDKQDDNIQPWRTPFLIWNQSVVPYPVLTVASWPAYRFLSRQVRWFGIPISQRIFKVCYDPHKGFGVVKKVEVGVFLELSCFFDDPADFGNLISGSSAYMLTLLLELSDQISRSVVSNSLRPHESQHASPPCPSPTPGVHWDSRELCLPWNYLSTLKITVKKFAILTIFKCFSGVKLTHVCLQGSSFAELFLQNFFILQNWNSVPIKQLLLSSSFQPLATTILRCFHEFDLIRSLIQHLSLCDFYFS